METKCLVCADEGLYFCRICSLYYCCEHLCSHLSVAWESNTWSTRENFNANNTRSGSIREQEADQHTRTTIQNNAKSLPACSEAELQESLDYYRFQIRRIRAELERRSLLVPGLYVGGSGYTANFNTTHRRKPRNRRLDNKGYNATVQLLCNLVRKGSFTVEQVEILLKERSK